MNQITATLIVALEHNTELSSSKKEEIRRILSGNLPPYEEILKKQTDEFNGESGELEGYECPICKNKGVIAGYDSKTLNHYFTECSCMKIRRTLRRIKESGLENQLRNCTFKSFETKEKFQKELKSIAMEFIGNEDAKGIYIGGQTGCGKTHICTAIAGQYIKQGKSVRYMTWRDDSVVLKSYANSPEYHDIISEFKQSDVLYIDDLFKQDEIKDADKKLAFEIIDYRIRNRLITIISSELYISDLIEIDEALAGRIIHLCGKYKIVIMRDRKKNYRLKGI